MSETEYQEAKSEVPAPENIRYAGFWMRFWAYIIDLIVVFSINGILLSPLKFINNGDTIDIYLWTVTGLLDILVLYVYFLLMTKFFGQTLGKMALGLKVIRFDQQPLSWRDLIFREVIGRFIHRVFWFMNLLYLFVAFNEQKQGLHDIIGSTRVIFNRQ